MKTEEEIRERIEELEAKIASDTAGHHWRDIDCEFDEIYALEWVLS